MGSCQKKTWFARLGKIVFVGLEKKVFGQQRQQRRQQQQQRQQLQQRQQQQQRQQLQQQQQQQQRQQRQQQRLKQQWLKQQQVQLMVLRSIIFPELFFHPKENRDQLREPSSPPPLHLTHPHPSPAYRVAARAASVRLISCPMKNDFIEMLMKQLGHFVIRRSVAWSSNFGHYLGEDWRVLE